MAGLLSWLAGSTVAGLLSWLAGSTVAGLLSWLLGSTVDELLSWLAGSTVAGLLSWLLGNTVAELLSWLSCPRPELDGFFFLNECLLTKWTWALTVQGPRVWRQLSAPDSTNYVFTLQSQHRFGMHVITLSGFLQYILGIQLTSRVEWISMKSRLADSPEPNTRLLPLQ